MTTHQIHMAFVTGGSGFVGRHLFADWQARRWPEKRCSKLGSSQARAISQIPMRCAGA